ncbi:CAP domain-containing protein [Solirubrobacter taibaiensis]|nr:CAP domain-containing protein [Solirubrobacter taibaiensis]
MTSAAALLLSLATIDPTIVAVNTERARHGLKPFAQHTVLERSADRFAARLVRTNRFAHESRIRVPAGRFVRLGEVLAQGGRTFTPADAVRAWMSSPPHRRILLSRKFTHAGAGAAGSTIRVMHFGASSS